MTARPNQAGGGGGGGAGGPAMQLVNSLVHKTTYAPMIYTALCVMLLMRADTLLELANVKLNCKYLISSI
jgi:hypothetical protein